MLATFLRAWAPVTRSMVSRGVAGKVGLSHPLKSLNRQPGRPLPPLTDVRGGAVRSQPAVVVEGGGKEAQTINTAVGGAHTVALCAQKSKNSQNRVFTPSAWIDGYLDVTVITGVPEVFKWGL